MLKNAAWQRILPFVATIALHLIPMYFLMKASSSQIALPEISIQVTLINAASIEKTPSAKTKAKTKQKKSLEKTTNINKPTAIDTLEEFEKGDKSSAVTEPRYNSKTLNNLPPSYPSLARRLGQQGTVVLRVLVLSSGNAGSVAISQSSGFGQLDEVALNTVRNWHFIPAKSGVNAVDHLIDVPITFKLNP